MYDFMQIQTAVLLSNVMNLFNDTLTVVYNEPTLRLFLAAVLLFVVVALLVRLIRPCGRGRL